MIKKFITYAMELQVSHSIAPKYRRKVFYEDKRLEVGAILRELCKWKEVTIITVEVCPDHVHMLVKNKTIYRKPVETR